MVIVIRNADKEIYEGWTVRCFIEELLPIAKMIKEGKSWIKPFTNKLDLKKWVKREQPYYKKNIQEVFEYFVKYFEL